MPAQIEKDAKQVRMLGQALDELALVHAFILAELLAPLPFD